MAHMAGSAPFPCPRPLGGGFKGTAQLSPPYVVLESPNSVITE